MLLSEFNIQEDLKAIGQLRECDDFRGSDLSNEGDLSTLPKRTHWGSSIPSWETLVHHLFNMQIHKELFKSIREIALAEKKDEFKREITLRRVSKIPTSKTPNGLLGMDFVDYGDQTSLRLLQDTFRDIR